jgi:hypothetical protein
MGFFDILAFFLAGGLLVAAFVRQPVVATETFQRAMMLFFAALVVHDLISGIPVVGFYLGMVAVPIGYALALWSFRELCLAVAARTGSRQDGPADEAY